MIKPKQYILEATNRCNLQCRYCPSVENTGKFPVGDMSVEFFKSIVDRIAAESPESTVIPWANGEPFLHPKYFEMMAYLNSKGLRYYVTTNLTIWREDVLRELLRHGSGCYQLIISMDGLFGSGNIARARPGTDEELLRRNIGRLIALKEEISSETELAFKICRRGQDYGRSSGTSSTGWRTPVLTSLSWGMRLWERTTTRCGQTPASTSTPILWSFAGLAM